MVLPIPLLGNGRPAASLEGESLLELEAVYDEITADGIASRSWTQTLRVLPVQDPAAVVLNGDVIPWVAQQRAGRAVEEAMRASEAGDLRTAIERLRHELHELERFGDSAAAKEARRFVQELLDRLQDEGGLSVQQSKATLYSSRSRRRMSSSQHWVGETPAPDFIKPRPSTSHPGHPRLRIGRPRILRLLRPPQQIHRRKRDMRSVHASIAPPRPTLVPPDNSRLHGNFSRSSGAFCFSSFQIATIALPAASPQLPR